MEYFFNILEQRILGKVSFRIPQEVLMKILVCFRTQSKKFCDEGSMRDA
jgi:hypothetical protein